MKRDPLFTHVPLLEIRNGKTTRWLIYTSKMSKKHLWKSDILLKVAGQWTVNLLKMSLW